MTDSDELDMKYPCLHLDGGEVWEHVFLIGSNVYIEDISLKGAPHPLRLTIYTELRRSPSHCIVLSPGFDSKTPTHPLSCLENQCGKHKC